MKRDARGHPPISLRDSGVALEDFFSTVGAYAVVFLFERATEYYNSASFREGSPRRLDVVLAIATSAPGTPVFSLRRKEYP
mmetsp:Transcript_12132/g.19578  ORF Transcript_12132/g.19578 Transcript_12132/m.19578 type:complete len:81 (+) Transcript_12132:315-557(+)